MPDERKFLLPGEYAVTRTPCELATLLGSCVSVTLWHPVKRYAAMTHFLLPEYADSKEDKWRYGDTSTANIIWLMAKLDPNVKKLQANIYGGGAVVGHLGSTGNIGDRNIDIARKVLTEKGIKVMTQDVAGENGRRIYMDSMTGKVTVRLIEKSEDRVDREKKRVDMSSRKIRVLIVDDSRLVRSILSKAVSSTPDMEVCGEAEDAFEARKLILETDPDIISLDIIMPKMSGLDFLKKLSEHFPKPVVICSTIAKAGSDIAQKARQYGAVGSVDKDKLEIYKGMDTIRKEYIPRLRTGSKMIVKKKLFD